MTSVQMRHSPCVDTKRAVTPIKPLPGSPVSQREVTSSTPGTQQNDMVSQRQAKAGSPHKHASGANNSPAVRSRTGGQSSAKGQAAFCDKNEYVENGRDSNSKDSRTVIVRPSPEASGSPYLVRASDQTSQEKDISDKGRHMVVV